MRTTPVPDPWSQVIAFDDLDRDPYPIFARLRSEAPIAWVPNLNSWVASRWDACRRIGGDRENFSGSDDPALQRVVGKDNILSADGDLHQDLRAFIDPQLRPRAVNGYIEELVRPIARSHLEAIRDAGCADLMAAYFEPVSVRALGDLLGLQAVDSDTLRRWFHGLADGMSNKGLDPEGFRAADAAVAEIREVVGPMLERLAEQPDHSGLSHWLHDGMPAGHVRSHEYIYPTLFVMLTGGLQEPGHGAANTLLGLFSRPEQLQEVRDDLDLVAKAVAEGLRWLTPIGATFRTAKRDVELDGGPTIRTGQTVLLMLASANRDEQQFNDADVFDLHRSEPKHMAFGNGDHLCSGHFFARHLERIALEELLTTFPTLQLDPDRPPRPRGWIFRAPQELHAGW